jgi:hypothetical protein
MKNFATILVFAFTVTFTANAQQQKDKQNRPQFTIEQQTELSVKRMTLALDLNEKQQNQLKPLLKVQATQRKAAMEKMKKAREARQRPSDDELFSMKNQQLDNRIAMKSKMKEILTKEQFDQFEKMAKVRGQKMMEARKGMKKRMQENQGKK